MATVMTAARAASLDIRPLATIKSFASSGVDPALMGMGPVPASRRCLDKAGRTAAQLDLMEINEAFAAQAAKSNPPRTISSGGRTWQLHALHS